MLLAPVSLTYWETSRTFQIGSHIIEILWWFNLVAGDNKQISCTVARLVSESASSTDGLWQDPFHHCKHPVHVELSPKGLFGEREATVPCFTSGTIFFNHCHNLQSKAYGNALLNLLFYTCSKLCVCVCVLYVLFNDVLNAGWCNAGHRWIPSGTGGAFNAGSKNCKQFWCCFGCWLCILNMFGCIYVFGWDEVC